MKKNHIAHVINVAEITDSNKGSYLHIAQPITLKSVVIARRAAAKVVDVDLYAIKHKDERVEIPEEFKWLPDIAKYSVAQITSEKKQKRVNWVYGGKNVKRTQKYNPDQT